MVHDIVLCCVVCGAGLYRGFDINGTKAKLDVAVTYTVYEQTKTVLKIT